MPTPSLTTQKEINLHLDKPNDLVYVQAKQYDALSRNIKINLFFNDAPWTLPGNIALSSTGSTSAIYAMVRYLKPDGTKGMYDTDEENNQAVTGTSGNSYIIVRLAEQVLVVKGKVFTEISFYNADGQKLTSFGFIINVEASSVSDEEYVSSDYYNLLRHDIQAIYDLNDAFVSATQAAVSGTLTIDDTLTIHGAIADAKAAGEIVLSQLDVDAQPYSTSATYSVGEYCIRNNKLYRCTTAITSGESWNSAHWFEVVSNMVLVDDPDEEVVVPTYEEFSDLRSDFDSLNEFTRKNVVIDFNAELNVSSGDYSQSTKILDVSIPSGKTYTLRLSLTATHGAVVVYAMHPNGYTALSYNFVLDTDNVYVASNEIVAINVYVPSNGVTSDGTLSAHCEYINSTENSLQERVEILEGQQVQNITKNNMEMYTLTHFDASNNRFDYSKLIEGKKFSIGARAEVTDATECLYYLDVHPGDSIYFWRLHNGSVMSSFSDNVATFDENGALVVNSCFMGYTYNLVVPSGIYKLGLNYLNNYVLLDKGIIIFNSSDNPGYYEDFRDENDAYLSTLNSQQNVDYNVLLPLSMQSSAKDFMPTFGHMGLSEYYPGNTDLSIIGAKKSGLSGVEMDVQITLDGVYVLYHDTDMQRVGGTAAQNIGNMTFEQLQQFDYGAWKSPLFAGTELCTFEKAVKLCRFLCMDIFVDCKTIETVQQFADASEIIDRWGMHDHTYWLTGSFLACWDAIPDAKIIFAAGSKLTGSTWPTDEGWFDGFTDNFPDKTEIINGVRVFRSDVFVGISNDYLLKDDLGYGVAGLQRETELAKKYNIKYGLYAVDDIDTIHELAEDLPYMQYMTSNKISFQNAMNKYYEITKADYIY